MFALVGIGSFAFHGTLQYAAQLADELPMIYTSSCIFFILFDTSPGFEMRNSSRGQYLSTSVVLFDVLFTWSYRIYRNPIYHQCVFAALMVTIGLRGRWLLESSHSLKHFSEGQRSTINRLFLSGAGSFVLGFVIWNLDNVFCETLTHWKVFVTWPVAFLLEGHSWWHVLTGTGSYLVWVGTIYLTLCIKDDPRNYSIVYVMGYLPHIQRLEKPDINIE